MAGLTPGESAVMELHKLGYGPAQIASELSISPARARVIVSTYDDDPAHDRFRENQIKLGSHRLLQRLQAVGGHR